MKRIDVHSHLLPGVDDGCRTVEESVACARLLVEAGYSHCFCTPHAWPNLEQITRGSVPHLTRRLQDHLDAADVQLTLLAGAELNLRPTVLQADRARLIEYGGDSGYILFDLWAERLPPWFEQAVQHLKSLGLQPVLAHPERMRAVQDEPELADHFQTLGLLLQGNLQCFADKFSSRTRQIADQYLREGRYFVLGSDTHDRSGLISRLAGLENALRLVGREAVDQLTAVNPQRFLPTPH